MGSKRKPTFENEATERRRRIALALLDALTNTGSELQPDDVPHFRLVASWFGGTEVVDRILAAYKQKKSTKNRGMSADHNQIQEEVLLSIAITWLRPARLSRPSSFLALLNASNPTADKDVVGAAQTF